MASVIIEPDVPSGRARKRARRDDPPSACMVGPRQLVSRPELLRLIQQAIDELGYHEVARDLERTTGLPTTHASVHRLTDLLLQEKGLPAGNAYLKELSPGTRFSGSKERDDRSAIANARRIICTQHLRELAADRMPQALEFLRSDAASLATSTPGGQSWLAGAVKNVLLRSQRDFVAASDGTSKTDISLSRGELLDRVLSALPATFHPPKGRLVTLLESTLEAQVSRAELHNSAKPQLSLLRDYHPSTAAQLPQSVAQVLFDHEDEVWHLAFNRSGTMLASASRDGTAVLWDVASGKLACPMLRRHTLSDGAGPIAYLSWSPDDALLATCSQDGCVRLWDVVSGRRVRALRHHSDPVSCAAWLPGRRGLITVGLDERVCHVDPVSGAVKRHWHVPRVQEVVIAKAGGYILATTAEQRIAVLDIRDDLPSTSDNDATWQDSLLWSEPQEQPLCPTMVPWLSVGPGSHAYIQECEPVLAMSLSTDERYLLVNLTNGMMRLYDLGPDPLALRVPVGPCAQFPSPSPGRRRFVVRSCLGGVDDRFAVTGSESGKIFIYQRSSGKLVLTLTGHTATVNAVAWNPAEPGMLASASDDKTVLVWLPKRCDRPCTQAWTL